MKKLFQYILNNHLLINYDQLGYGTDVKERKSIMQRIVEENKMKKQRTFGILLGLLLALGLAGNTHAQLDLEKGAVLTREAFIKEALTKDPEFTNALQQYLQAKYSEISSKEISDWTLSASAALNHYEATSALLSSGSDSDTLSYELGVQKLFLVSGTRVSLTHSNALTEAGSSMYSLASESSSPKVTLSVTQPLLKNAFGLSDRYPVVVAEIQRKAAYADALEAWEGRVLELEKAYLAWISAYETAKAYPSIIKELTKLLNTVQRKYKSGVSEEKDLVQTEENLLQYQSQLLQAETDYLNETMNIAYLQAGQAVGEDALAIKPELDSKPAGETKLLDEKQIKSLRLLAKLELLKEQQLQQSTIADNSGLPSLDLVGSYSRKGEEADLSGGYAALGEHQDYTVRLQASLPLGGYKPTGDQGQARAALLEIEASIQETQRAMTLSVRQMAAQIEMLEQTLAIQKTLVAKGERKLELDNANYKIGRLDIYYLIDTQNSLTNARLNYIKKKIQLDQTKIEYLAMTDRLLASYPDLLKRIEE